nr:hypothetical protein [Anaerolineae bacterium]
MSESIYRALDPDVEVLGAAIMATIAGMEKDVLPILEKHGITNLTPEGWYPQQAWLNTLSDIDRSGSLIDLASIGMRIPENAVWPEHTMTITEGLASIDVAYHMNHRNGEIGEYRPLQSGPNEMKIICTNPYPSDFDYGIIYATAQKFLPAGMSFKVIRDASPSRMKGDDCCIYTVTWW